MEGFNDISNFLSGSVNKKNHKLGKCQRKDGRQ